MKKLKYLNYLGALFLTLGLLAIFNSIFIVKNNSQIVWLCYSGLIILGIGVMARKGTWIASQLNVLFIPLLLWNIDFFYHLLTSTSLFGITDYFFTPGIDFWKIISLQHIITIPLAVFCLYKIGLKKEGAWKISIPQVTLFYFLTILFTSPEQNLNCVFAPCANIEIAQGYPIVWFLTFIITILLTNITLNKLFIKKSSNRVIF